MRSRFTRVAAIAVAAAAASQAIVASGANPTVVYSDIVTSPTSNVPGLAGAQFNSFDRPYVSPNGVWWAFTALTNLATTQDEVIVVGSGMAGTVVLQEGVTPIAPPATETAGLIDRNLFLTNSADFSYATNSDAATTADEVVGRRFGGVFDVPVREGAAAPGLPGVTLGISNSVAGLASDGRVGFLGTSLIGATTATNAAVFFGNSVVAQKGVTIPAGQAGGATNTWELFDFEDQYFANNGATYLLRGDTNAASGDDVLVYNGTVVLQEGQVIPGSGFVSPIETGGSTESILTPNGDWWARGENADLTDWIVRNGSVIIRNGDAVPGSPGEIFDDAAFADCFFSMAGNSLGDYVYGGVTNNSDLAKNAVLVFNNQFVLHREGDPVDLDGNGLFDDDAFISVFNNEDAFLTDSLLYYFTADLRNGAGTAIGQAFMITAVPEPTALALCGIAAAGLLRRRRA